MIDILLNLGELVLNTLQFIFIATPIGGAILFTFILYRLKIGQVDEIISAWSHPFENFHCLPQEFYSNLHGKLLTLGIPNLEVKKVSFYESIPFLSRRRIYLRIRQGVFVYDVCASPYAHHSFFFSWWYGHKLPWYRKLLRVLPYLGERLDSFFFPITYYTEDSSRIFHQLIKKTFDNTIDEFTKEVNIILSDASKQPLFQDILSRA